MVHQCLLVNNLDLTTVILFLFSFPFFFKFAQSQHNIFKHNFCRVNQPHILNFRSSSSKFHNDRPSTETAAISSAITEAFSRPSELLVSSQAAGALQLATVQSQLSSAAQPLHRGGDGLPGTSQVLRSGHGERCKRTWYRLNHTKQHGPDRTLELINTASKLSYMLDFKSVVQYVCTIFKFIKRQKFVLRFFESCEK